jgi:hypothetical protein
VWQDAYSPVINVRILEICGVKHQFMDFCPKHLGDSSTHAALKVVDRKKH